MITKILETLKPVATSLEFLLSYYYLDVKMLYIHIIFTMATTVYRI